LGATKQIQASGAELRERMNRQMGLLQKPDPGDSSSFRKLMPDGSSDWSQAHFRNNRLEEVREIRLALQQRFAASKGFDQPFNAIQFGNLKL
jgi:hypothetical protein